MTQPKPNHHPPGSAAPRLVDRADDEAQDCYKVHASWNGERPHIDESSFRQVPYWEESQDKERTRAPSWTPWIIAALAIAVAVYAIAKTQAGTGL